MTKTPLRPSSSDVAENAALQYQQTIYDAIDRLSSQLQELNSQIHSHPELCYQEHFSCGTLVRFLREQGLQVTDHAFGLETSFVAEFGIGGRVVVFCAEYDALADIGHACGHNLIATASTAAFLGAVDALKASNLPGRVRLLGCPAEEGGGGKIRLLEAGAFSDVDAALMAHPGSGKETPNGPIGVAYGTCSAATGFQATFQGKAAHAGAMPWMGVNALDAASLAYTAVGLLRQQCRPTDRVNIIFSRDSKSGCGVITEKTSLEFGIRCTAFKEVEALQQRVKNCIEGAALATACSVTYSHGMDPYAELRPNETLCVEFTKAMQGLGIEFLCDTNRKDVQTYGTDMGNVSYACPSLHAIFVIPTEPGQTLHSSGFALAASTTAAHDAALASAKGMGFAGLSVLLDNAIASQVQENFIKDKQTRRP